MSRVIVTGVDGSKTASEAAVRAAELSVALDAELIVICAFRKLEVEEVEADGRHYVFTTEESAQSTAQEAVRALLLTYPQVRAKALAAKGRPADVLLEVASASNATLIVVGNKRVQGTKRLMGSIATSVAHSAPCDVYIAHTHSRG